MEQIIKNDPILNYFFINEADINWFNGYKLI
jgi:hypothetical protein